MRVRTEEKRQEIIRPMVGIPGTAFPSLHKMTSQIAVASSAFREEAFSISSLERGQIWLLHQAIATSIKSVSGGGWAPKTPSRRCRNFPSFTNSALRAVLSSASTLAPRSQ